MNVKSLSFSPVFVYFIIPLYTYIRFNEFKLYKQRINEIELHGSVIFQVTLNHAHFNPVKFNVVLIVSPLLFLLFRQKCTLIFFW